MDNVSTVMVTTWIPDNVDRLNELLGFRGEMALVASNDKRFEQPWYGGDKYSVVVVALGAYRDLDLDALVEAMNQVEWLEPEYVQLFVCRSPAQKFAEIQWRARPAEGSE